MFNLSGSEIVFLLLIALIVLGPEKLPEAVRKFGKAYAEIKKMSSGFQSELKSALDEPMREMRETADAFKKAANFDFDDSGGAERRRQHARCRDASRTRTSRARRSKQNQNQSQPEPVEPEPAEAAAASNEPPLVRPPGPTFHSAAPQPKVVETDEETASE